MAAPVYTNMSDTESECEVIMSDTDDLPADMKPDRAREKEEADNTVKLTGISPNSDEEYTDEETELPQINPLENIKNKVMRRKAFMSMKAEIRKREKEEKRDNYTVKRKSHSRNRVLVKKKVDPALAADKKVPHTIDSRREAEDTTVEAEDEELELEEATDTYAGYFTKTCTPKIMITSSDNPHSKSVAFMRELGRIIPGSEIFWRKRSSIKKMVAAASGKGFTDVMVINEDKRVPNGLLVVHLPDGPSAYFRMSNAKVSTDIHKRFKDISNHRPEVILNNFKTRLGRVVARMLGALFHYDPEFKGRRVCTFQNQRDYIFFRHHRYQFKTTEKVKLRELGPRFTLRLQWLQEGAFTGDYEWVLKRHEMETSRRRFVL